MVSTKTNWKSKLYRIILMSDKFKDFLFEEDGLENILVSESGLFKAGANGVSGILRTGDGKAEFVCFDDGQVVSYVGSKMGYPAMYPMQ